MSVGGRSDTRQRMLRRAALIGGVLALLALLFLLSGHWLLAIIFGAVAAVAIWLFLQARTVR
jgi:uncharacterized membrane protein YgaE (UPF0421/DUF939 family)